MIALSDDAERLQLEIQLLEAAPADAQLAGTDDREGVREVEDRKRVELRDHLEPAVPAGRLDVLAERVAVAHRDGPRQRREEGDGLLRMEGLARQLGSHPEEGLRFRHELVGALEEVEHPDLREPRVGAGELEDPILSDERAQARAWERVKTPEAPESPSEGRNETNLI